LRLISLRLSLFLVCYLMTLSALTKTFGGIVRPICFAACRLITSLNVVGCCTGKLPGLAVSSLSFTLWVVLADDY
ncbi:MAG: hypothetical protein ACREQA_10335, partial [Candidatus Binatia bacterium]